MKCSILILFALILRKLKTLDMILTIAWPDTYVTSTKVFYDKFFKSLGINKGDKYKAGHAALVLIDPTTGVLEYYDFGRYITPLGYGRVRGSNTDFEIHFPFKAKFHEDGSLKNWEEIFLYLSNSEFTHGDGRMIISAIKEIDYHKAKSFIQKEQNRHCIAYGPFVVGGTNCSRFVADTIIAGTTKSSVRFKTKYPIYITPSPLGNTLNACTDGKIWSVYKNEIIEYPASRSVVLNDLVRNFTEEKKFSENGDTIGTLQEPIKPNSVPPSAQWLSGIGAGAWYDLVWSHHDEYIINRYDPKGINDLSGIYVCERNFDRNQEYQFTYPSHGTLCTLKQGDKELSFVFIAKKESLEVEELPWEDGTRNVENIFHSN